MTDIKIDKSKDIKAKVKERFAMVNVKKKSSIRMPQSGKGI
ncbi:MAG: hypothetical protein WCP85_18095 [Mariniphaga sp.]